MGGSGPTYPRAWRAPAPEQQAALSWRERGKRRGAIKRRFGLNRRDVGAIGAGHLAAPDGFAAALVESGLYRWLR